MPSTHSAPDWDQVVHHSSQTPYMPNISRPSQVLLVTLPKINDAKPPANPPTIMLMGCPYMLQKPLN